MSKHLLAVLALATFATACVVPVETQEDEEVGTDVAALIDDRDPGENTHFVGSCALTMDLTKEGHVRITPVPCESYIYVDMGDPWDAIEPPIGTGQ